ncbi:hypothetical protein LAV_00171 [Sphingobium phage Lacusarx]|uniref:Uncharacterized protein n=1 Tax=Sphingobium phage Lacusarx TaxID=1980139 RepID=A0A1W6DXF3_9CAUD|nr:hypothetical protein FDH44_gp132 [Sphingobium phage Lacusarx]ARK07546.1 hypothetical protein LAV_00171 [Sphingobium phage Lacusarx]
MIAEPIIVRLPDSRLGTVVGFVMSPTGWGPLAIIRVANKLVSERIGDLTIVEIDRA